MRFTSVLAAAAIVQGARHVQINAQGEISTALAVDAVSAVEEASSPDSSNSTESNQTTTETTTTTTTTTTEATTTSSRPSHTAVQFCQDRGAVLGTGSEQHNCLCNDKKVCYYKRAVHEIRDAEEEVFDEELKRRLEEDAKDVDGEVHHGCPFTVRNETPNGVQWDVEYNAPHKFSSDCADCACRAGATGQGVAAAVAIVLVWLGSR
mmetsp:Transcript_54761/g.120087  ORF Transcript_54761/g.120087 Transcript_54761/m.120087 type:complete len:207 (+) Transcript_54761:58-678(+)|eukprot:CAMPEP_0204274448 /NCGR_PEP_ID=MMETSP0468-20130131/25194_1 /ASSEMBLY_ACC=CAM_ASM_000383 /TAXON_ID=2969 /ORGANISM="Oxyrrhis marina" /LENGTH=206 /DNA_ID=CAMNT_0051250659 /DNA_START=55 /DNA_END=675 /DNA_ORIENTATION=+